MSGVQKPLVAKEWGSPLFGCLTDVQSCLAVWCCGCFVRGCIYYKVIRRDKKWAQTACLISLAGGNLGQRFHLAEHEGISRDIQTDCIMSCLFGSCALCQEYRYMCKEYYKETKSPMDVWKDTLGQ